MTLPGMLATAVLIQSLVIAALAAAEGRARIVGGSMLSAAARLAMSDAVAEARMAVADGKLIVGSDLEFPGPPGTSGISWHAAARLEATASPRIWVLSIVLVGRSAGGQTRVARSSTLLLRGGTADTADVVVE